MRKQTKTDLDTILAYVSVQRVTDRLLDVADELRLAREKLDQSLKRAGGSVDDEGAGNDR